MSNQAIDYRAPDSPQTGELIETPMNNSIGTLSPEQTKMWLDDLAKHGAPIDKVRAAAEEAGVTLAIDDDRPADVRTFDRAFGRPPSDDNYRINMVGRFDPSTKVEDLAWLNEQSNDFLARGGFEQKVGAHTIELIWDTQNTVAGMSEDQQEAWFARQREMLVRAGHGVDGANAMVGKMQALLSGIGTDFATWLATVPLSAYDIVNLAAQYDRLALRGELARAGK